MLARLLWDQAKTPEMQAAYGADAAQVITDRRRDYEDALVALGEAEAAAAPADLIDLREQWGSLEATQRREQLRRYPVERVMVGGPKPEQWRVVFK